MEIISGDTGNDEPVDSMEIFIFHMHSYEYRTKLGMTKVVLRGSWGCHCCKTDRGPPLNDTQNDTPRKVCTWCRHCKTDRGPPYFRMSLRHVPNFVRNSYGKNVGLKAGFLISIGMFSSLQAVELFGRPLPEVLFHCCPARQRGAYARPSIHIISCLWCGPSRKTRKVLLDIQTLPKMVH